MISGLLLLSLSSGDYELNFFRAQGDIEFMDADSQSRLFRGCRTRPSTLSRPCDKDSHNEKFSSPATGIEKFKGCYFHSREYKSPEAFSGKRIIVVGTGNSGVDTAMELGHVAKQVCLLGNHGLR